MKNRRPGHIGILSGLFEESNYPFDWDGKRLRVLTNSSHVRPDPKTGKKYINIIDNLSTGYTKASICSSVTIADALKSYYPQAYKDFIIKLNRSKANKSKGGNFYVLFLKPDYDLEMVKKIIKSIKSDYMRQYVSKKRQTNKRRVSALGQTLNKNSVQLNRDQGYNDDWWPFVQDTARVKADMKCVCCGVDFKISMNKGYWCEITGDGFEKWPSLYHVHHKDRNKKNDSPENLAPLCVTCHSFEPGKGHKFFRTGIIKKNNKGFRVYESNMLHHRILNQMRRRQGIDMSFDFDFETLERKVPIVNAKLVIEKQSLFQKVLSSFRMALYQMRLYIS